MNMNWNLVIQVVATVILKLIASALFLVYGQQILYTPVLEEDPNATPKDCPNGWQSLKDKCYFFSTKEETWDENQKTCAQFSSHLAVVNSEEELVFLKSRSHSQNYFIGITKRDGVWTWIDNTKFDLSIFDGSQGHFQCVVVGVNSVGTASCSVQHGSICEKNA